MCGYTIPAVTINDFGSTNNNFTLHIITLSFATVLSILNHVHAICRMRKRTLEWHQPTKRRCSSIPPTMVLEFYLTLSNKSDSDMNDNADIPSFKTINSEEAAEF
ncbi:hypothetical protein BC936DRAFT_145484 [Jimgerdemannia flammicorona]|uniref:Uncharacterized protein n=1 Tax=Jimgerdemannia flammicorona TaxID=994334 RepID=A0A433DAJ6_9FUNG|nr:hypothetical protein BC936DRAFT_145484 [Jimgerdemannia flammicorona]